MELSLINNKIIKNIASIPGVLAFCAIDETHKVLKEENKWINSTLINLDDGVISFSMAIIISIDSRINNIYKQIKEQIKFDYEKQGYKVNKINIYVKGIK